MIRYLRPLLIVCAILALLAGLLGPAGPDTAAASAPKVDPEVLARLDRDGQGTFLVYLAAQADLAPAYHIRDWNERGWFVYNALREVADRTQPAVLQALDSLEAGGHVTVAHPYYIVNLIVVHGDAVAARALARRPDVAAVYPEMKISLVEPITTGTSDPGPQAVEWNLVKIGADQVWSTYGVTGTGSVVANIDTGVEYDHPALIRQYRGNLGGGNFDHNYNWWDPTFQYSYPYPVEGAHGTHTMGTEVGEDISHTNQIGVAPGAKWIAAYGCCPDNEALLSATQWMIAPTDLTGNNPDPSKRPYVVNNSWGGPGGSLIFNALMTAQRAAGIFPAYSAGNNGPQCGTLGSPGDNPSAFSSGATDVNDNIAGFSSRGPDPFHSWMGLYATGPDVSAPGVNIRSSVPGGGYESGWSGTSMASPHTAGSVGLILSAEPDLLGQVDELEELLRRTAVPRTSTQECGGVSGDNIPNNTFGWGRIDVKAAVDMIWHAGTLQGTVTDQTSGDPIAGARIGMLRNGYVLTTETDAAGHYEYLLGEGTYTITVQAYGYVPWMQGGVGILQDNTTTLDVQMVRLPQHALSGTVAEGTVLVPGEPLDALVGLYGTPILVNTDPPSGWYTTTPALGSYWMRTTARGYMPDNRVVTVTADLTEDVNLAPRWTYYVRDSRSPCGPPFIWVDATDGTQVCLGDDANTPIAPGLPFTYYGTTYDNYFISSNGFVSFGMGYSRGHMVFPFEGRPNNAVYAFEEDLNPAGCAQGTIYWKVVGNRYVVIEFYQVEHWASGDPETFEFIFDTQRGTIKLQYLEVSWPDFTSVGLENEDGSDGIMYSYANSAAITNGLAVGFGPVYGRLPADQDALGLLGTLSGTVYVTGTTTPVPGAVVTATGYINSFTSTADLSGNYLFPDICADIYWLQAGDPAYYPSQVAEARLRWAGDVAVNDLYLETTLPCDPVHATDFAWAPTTPTLGMEVTFQGTASGTTPISFTWDLGDGTMAGGATVMHTYAATGTYTVLVTATNCGGTDQASHDVVVVAPEILPPPPPPALPLNPGGESYGAITITNAGEGELDWSLAESPDADWLLEAPVSGTLAAGDSAVVLLTYTAPITTGVYTTNLRISSNDPLHPVVNVPVEMDVIPPCGAVQIAAITPTIAGCDVTFEAALTGDGPFTYLWAFGDGVTSTVAMPTHTYAQTGTYSGTLDVWNCAETGHASMDFTVTCVARYTIYLPVVTKAFAP